MTRVIALVAILSSSLPATAQPKRLLKIDDLYRFDGPRDMAVAPDGKSAVFIRQWIDAITKTERQSLWRIAAIGEKPIPVEDSEPDARVPLYSPDGKWLAFLSTRNRAEGWTQTRPVPPESDPATDIWLMPATGGAAIPLGGPEKPYGRVFNDGFYGRLAFSPDSTRLAFIADDGADPQTTSEKERGVRIVRDDQGEGYTGYDPAQVWIAYLDSKPEKFAASKMERLTNDEVWYGDPQWSPDGKSIVVHANRTADRESVRFSINKNFDIWRIDAATKEVRQLTGGIGPEVSPRISPDGKRLACLSVPRKGAHRETFNLMIVDLDGDAKSRVLHDHHAKPDDPPHLPPAFPLPIDCWDGNRHLIYNSELGVRSETIRLDVLTRQGDAMPGGRPSTRGKFMLPGNVFLEHVTLAEQKVDTWKSNDGMAIEGIITIPPAESGAKPPYKLLVYPHGGPHSRSALGFDFTVQIFAANGYAVFQPNFRGSSGYGQKFIDADRGDFGFGDMNDILSGVDRLIADGIVDKNRTFAYGISYGGFMTSWLVGQTNRFRAAVAQNAVTDLTMMWSLSDLRSWTEWEFRGRPWQVPDAMRKHSPLTYANKVKTPTLILHSAADRRCPLPMGKAYHQALKANGVKTGLVIYPDEGHGVKQPRHREDVLRRVLDWFTEHDK
jgi:dipeptidyl aminopeptidase/acylaminoacyl peptidase